MDGTQRLVSLSGAVEDALLVRSASLVAASRILRDQITGRLPRRDAQRRTLAEIGTTLSMHALEDVASIMQLTSSWRGIARVSRSNTAVASHLPVVSTRREG